MKEQNSKKESSFDSQTFIKFKSTVLTSLDGAPDKLEPDSFITQEQLNAWNKELINKNTVLTSLDAAPDERNCSNRRAGASFTTSPVDSVDSTDKSHVKTGNIFSRIGDMRAKNKTKKNNI